MKYIDADRLRAEIEKIYKSEIAPWLSGVSAASAIYDYVLPLIDSLQQEQPELDLEIERIVKDEEKFMNFQARHQLIGYVARHFYNMGLNARNED